MPVIQFNVPAEMSRRLHQEAMDRGVPVSVVAREWLKAGRIAVHQKPRIDSPLGVLTTSALILCHIGVLLGIAA